MPSTFITSNTLIQRFADALFGVQVGSATIAQVIVDSGNTGIVGLKSVFSSYYTQSFGGMTSAQVADTMLLNLGIAVGKSGLMAADVKVARDYMISNLNATPSGQRGDAVSTMLSMFSGMTSDATFGAAATAFNGQIASSEAWGANNTNNVALGTSNTYYLTVGTDTIFGTAGNDTFVAKVVQNSAGQQVNTLGSGDVLNGGGGNDMLSAKITAGAYVNGGSSSGNQYQSLAQGSSTMPIQPETHGIQTVKLQAVNSSISGSNIAVGNTGNSAASTEVFVNAKDMADVVTISSDNSDANLTIQNLTTLNSDGSRHALNTDRIGMAFTGNSDSGWKESDLHVYFDQDYLTPTVTSSFSVDIRVMNQDAYDTTGGQSTALGITNSTAAIGPTYFYQLKISVNGKSYDLAPYLSVAASAGNSLITYANELAAIQIAIAQLKTANPTDAVLQTLTASFGATFTADAPVDPISGVAGAVRLGTSITLSVSGGATTTPLSVDTLLLAPVSQTNANMNLFNRAVTTSSLATNLAINVDLTKVGNWGDGGSLVIGSMYKDGLNAYTTQYAGKGINEFDVVVHGTKVTNGDDQSSSLKQLASTGNNLKVVKVVTGSEVTANFANLTIGNSQTENALGVITAMSKGTPSVNNIHSLRDVQNFDATGLKGNLTLFAGLSNDVTPKYLNVLDTGAPAADNVNFVYSGGSGSNYINLKLAEGNFAKTGTATREDMTLTVNGGTGTGSDQIVVKIADAAVVNTNGVVTGEANWYQNQHINATLKMTAAGATGQLQLNGGGAGGNTISKMGSGDFAINGGAGNDTIYAENTGKDATVDSVNGGRAIAVFNALRDNAGNYDVSNLLSDNHTLNFASTTTATLNVTVNILGFTATVAVVSVPGTASGMQTITDLMINQAVKAAVNSDPVLMKLAIAEDGPGHTLVLRSLVDGNMNINPVTGVAHAGTAADQIGNFSISLNALTVPGFATLTTAQIDNNFGTTAGVYANHFGDDASISIAAGVTAAALPGATTASIASAIAAVGIHIHTGADSLQSSDNLIVGGTGNDVIVLGTGGYHLAGNELLGSNDTIGYEGVYGLGNDTIVNFDTTMVASGTNEVSTVTFSLSTGKSGPETIVFDGVTLSLSVASTGTQGVIPAMDVASQFVQQYNTAVGTNWMAAVSASDPTKVVLTHNVSGFTPHLATSSFTGTYFSAGNGTVTPVLTTAGADAGTASQVVVNFIATQTAAVTASSFTFDGVSTSYAVGDGAVTLANKLAASTYVDYTAVSNGNGTVTFTAKVTGAVPVQAAGNFAGIDGNASDGIVGTVTSTLGSITGVVQGAGFDKLDFSMYHVGSVHLQGSVAQFATAPVGVTSTTYLDMSELTTPGIYTVTVHNADTTLVGTVGTINFGHHEAFVAQNFII